MTFIEENLHAVQKRIAAASAACGREPEEITLVAVSKNFPAFPEIIIPNGINDPDF